MFVIGTQYYRTPTPVAANWEKDLKNIKDYGMNVIRLWMVWNWFNQGEGVYDFSVIDKQLKICRQVGIKAIVLYNLESAPAWLQRKHPRTHYINEDDSIFYPDGVSNTPGGGMPGLCLDWEEIKTPAYNFLLNATMHLKANPDILAYEPHNEPMIEAGRYRDSVYCYCPKTIEVFHDWLRRKYGGDINKLNNFWRRRYGCFEEVQPPRVPGTYAEWIDWRVFAVDNLIEQEQWRADAIREGDPDAKVISHGRGQSGVLIDFTVEGIDDWRLARKVDEYGCAVFPQAVGIESSFLGMDVTRCAADGKDFFVGELQGGPIGIGLKRNQPIFPLLGGKCSDSIVVNGRDDIITPERLKLWSWMCVAQGAKGLLYWQYRNECYGREYGFGLTEMDGSPSPRMDAIKQISEIIAKNERLFMDAKPLKSEIAFGFTPVNHIIERIAENDIDKSKNSMLGLYSAHLQLDYPVDFVRLDEMALDSDYSGYKIIYLPFCLWMSKKSAKKIKEFVVNGGTVVADAGLVQYDTDLYSCTIVPGLGLNEVFGVRRKQIFSNYDKTEMSYRNIKITGCFYEEWLKPVTAEVVGRFQNEEAAVTINRFGKGKAIYIGSNIFMEFAKNIGNNLCELLKLINSEIRRPAYANNANVIVRVLDTGKEKIIFMLNPTKEKQACVLTVDCNVGRLVNIPDGVVDYRSDKNGLVCEFKLEPWGVRVLVGEA